ncbi:MAG: hypothetical protein AAFO75_06920, partial [Pseudomonadota bacterium]
NGVAEDGADDTVAIVAATPPQSDTADSTGPTVQYDTIPSTGDVVTAGASAQAQTDPVAGSEDAQDTIEVEATTGPQAENLQQDTAPSVEAGVESESSATSAEGTAKTSDDTAQPAATSAQTETDIAALDRQAEETVPGSPEAPAPASVADQTPGLDGPNRFFLAPNIATPLPVRIRPSPEALPGHTIILIGATRNFELTAGTKLMFDTWQVDMGGLQDMTLIMPKGFAREIPVTIELRRPDGLVLDTQDLIITTRGNPEAIALSQSVFDAAARAATPTANGLILRAERLIDNGDTLSARVPLTSAVEEGSALAAWMLAATFDDRFSEVLAIPANSTDAAQAETFFKLAAERGLVTDSFRPSD